MTLRLPDAEIDFFWAVVGQLEPGVRAIFAERVVVSLGAHRDPGPGDADRAIRAALTGLWVPPALEETRVPPRWSQAAPFVRHPKRAQRAADVVEQAP